MPKIRHRGVSKRGAAVAIVVAAAIGYSSSAAGKEPLVSSFNVERGPVGTMSLPQQQLAAIAAGRTQQQI